VSFPRHGRARSGHPRNDGSAAPFALVDARAGPGHDALKIFREKLSPVAHPLISCRHPRPHEGLSRAVLKVRAGSGACGRGLPNLDPGRHSQTLARAERNAAASGPPVGHYDPSGVLAPGDGEVLPSSPPIHGSAGREEPKIAAHVAPGDRLLSFRNGRSAPVSSSSSHVLACGGDDARQRRDARRGIILE
jgi:hypothetical protein